MWQEMTSHLSKFDQTGRERKRKKREKREDEKMRERLLLLSRFPSDQTFDSGRSKRGKVGPRIESYAWIPKTMDFIKLRDVGVLLLLSLFSI